MNTRRADLERRGVAGVRFSAERQASGRGLPAAAEPTEGHGDDQGAARRPRRGNARLAGTETCRRRDQGRRPPPPRPIPRAVRAECHRARRARSLGPGRTRRRRKSSRPSYKQTGHDEVIKVKSMATQEIGLVKALECSRNRRPRNRPRRDDHPALGTTARVTSWCRRSTATGPRSAGSSSTTCQTPRRT